MMKRLCKTISKNCHGVSMVLEASENFYGFRYENDPLRWGYNVSDCGTKEEVLKRIKRLIELTKEFIEDHTRKGYDVLVKHQQDELSMYNELYEYLNCESK